MHSEPITELIQRWQSGDALAFDRLIVLVYSDLRLMAARVLAGDGACNLQPTELVHDALMKVVGVDVLRINDRQHFFRAFARLMRNLIVDHVREVRAQKRGGDWDRVDILEAINLPIPTDVDIERLHAAIEELETADPRLAHIVELRYFVGLTMQEIARALDVDERTVYRGWAIARSWLQVQIVAE